MDLDSTIEQVAGRLDAYRKSGDVAELRKAAGLIAGIAVRQIADPEEREQARSTKLGLWLTLLDFIDSNKDPKFDPADMPRARIPVPDTPMKPGFPVRVPEGIADPAVRRKYAEAVAANAEKTRRYRLQKEIRQIDRELTPRAEAYITGQYPKSAKNRKDVDTAVGQFVQDPGRAAHIRSLVAPAER